MLKRMVEFFVMSRKEYLNKRLVKKTLRQYESYGIKPTIRRTTNKWQGYGRDVTNKFTKIRSGNNVFYFGNPFWNLYRIESRVGTPDFVTHSV